MRKEKNFEITKLDPVELLRVFGERPGRMKLLDDSIDRLGLDDNSRVLETGCSFGDGAAHVVERTGAAGYGLDIVEQYVQTAEARHPELEFDAGSVYEMPYTDTAFDLVFAQAAFSLLTQKDTAISEFNRVLVPGGHVIINDFVAKNDVAEDLRDRMDFIPCFNSIGTIDDYIEFFEERGFETVLAEDKYSEIISTTLHLSRLYECTPLEMAALFASILGTGRTAEENCRCFFHKTKISYAQFIFRKKQT